MGVPEVKVVRDWRGKYGVKVKWPRSGPWSRTMLFPRFVWHGPFGNQNTRWKDRDGAETFARILRETIAARKDTP